MRVALVTLVASAVACGSGGTQPRATASGNDAGNASGTASSAPVPTPPPSSGSAARVTPSPRTSAGDTVRATATALGPARTTPPAPAEDLPADSRCGTTRYRCTTLAEAVSWWDGKAALVPRGGTPGVRALLHAPSDPDVRRSDDPQYPPSFTYVLPDSLFPAMTARRGGTRAATESGGIVVSTYFVTERWLPMMDDRVSRRVTVRGRDAILSDFRTSDTGPLPRDVKWWVPRGDGTFVVWLVSDDGAHRSESELIGTLNALAEA